MLSEFRNVVELLDYYKEDATCIALLERERWGGKPVCPHCGYSEKIYRTTRGYKCGNKDCHKKFTVTVGTAFESSKIKLRYWYAAIYLCANPKKGISSHGLARTIGVTQKTAWFILHRVRKMLHEKKPAMLQGTIEADETYVGGKESNKHRQGKTGKMGRGTDKAPVLAMAERGGQVRTMPLENVKGHSLTANIYKNVQPGSNVITDNYNAYYMVRSRYTHSKVNHSKNEFVRGSLHTNTVEGYFSHFKRTVYGTYHQVSVKHLDAYCNESAFRYNCRFLNDSERFLQALRWCEGTLPYLELIAK